MAQNGLAEKVNMCRNRPCTCPRQTLHWDTRPIYQGQANSTNNYAVVVLNREIPQAQNFIIPFWNNATVRATVDGGTVKWEKYINEIPKENEEMIKDPNIISGDFDSITPEVLDKYRKKGCKIINTPDQLHTDFTKSLMQVEVYCEENNIKLDYIVAICQNSGRIDQSLGNIQTLHLVKEKKLVNKNTKVFLLSDDSIAWLLSPGNHIIDIHPDILEQRKPWCSMIPVGSACRTVTTSGLKWNLDHEELRFGELVSSSNTFDRSDSEQVNVYCSHTLLWAMKVPIPLQNP